jgi:ankyrin repeat protein
MVRLLAQYSREIPTLCYRGCVDRVRELVTDDPRRAREAGKNGYTALWWLPDDEDAAMQLVELLLAAGVDPSARNREGTTAADWARRRGMLAVADRLEEAASGPTDRPLK